jgi:DNA-binding Lrp family transcriptional regulator
MLSQLSEADRKMLGLLLDSEGRVSSDELSRQLKVPIGLIEVRRKTLEETYLIKHYSIDPTKFGWRRIDLLIYTDGGMTMSIGKELLKRKEVTSVTRMIGEHTIDLRVEVFVKDNSMLLNLIEDIKSMKGVRDVVWTEVVETIGRKNPPHHTLI